MKAGRIAAVLLAVVLVAIVIYAWVALTSGSEPAGQASPHAIDQSP